MQDYLTNPIHIGTGTYGAVYKATSISDGVEVCIKITNDITNEEDRKEIDKEVRKQGKLFIQTY
jgi:hypothetical protein